MNFQGVSDKAGRPGNNLLRHLSEGDYALIASDIEITWLAPDEILYNPGDQVEAVYFPCENSVACFVLAMDDGRELQVELIGREGALGGVVSGGRLPAFSRMTVRFGGPFARLPAARLEAARNKSPALANIFDRYADCLLAQILQGSACNAAHSIEQRAAKWILTTMGRTQRDVVPLSHEQLSTMLGVGRSYTTRVLRKFVADGVLKTARGSVTVLDKAALTQRSCNCNEYVVSHYSRVFKGIYLDPI